MAIGKDGGTHEVDGHKLVQGRKRHILADTPGLLIASRVKAVNVPDQKAGARLHSSRANFASDEQSREQERLARPVWGVCPFGQVSDRRANLLR